MFLIDFMTVVYYKTACLMNIKSLHQGYKAGIKVQVCSLHHLANHREWSLFLGMFCNTPNWVLDYDACSAYDLQINHILCEAELLRFMEHKFQSLNH